MSTGEILPFFVPLPFSLYGSCSWSCSAAVCSFFAHACLRWSKKNNSEKQF
ncbi:predicted protein [Arabidopsis lyrata subsp. lyrata]|uniref:Predicted protein n=1 Tax=Arabidopsis lyrata subsp. lyrata TaxID=81972 RepID=D7KAR0_ARALL|nr:predicted protein [Arabidopsis lyrata subsp. lyrata]